MTEQAKVPEIRFAGFTDPWEQRKLGDYVVVSTAKNADGRFNKEDVLSVSGEYGIVNQIAFQGRSFAGSSVLNYGIVNTGDIVYTKSPLNSNPYGIIKVNKGIPGIVSTLYAVYRPQDNVHTNFIQVYFEQHERMNNYMHPLVNKGAKNDMKVTAENALKGVVTFPSREEQVIISEFFDRLDSLITLHQRKYDKLVVFKKSMLEKMFPKDGESVPEIRFAGFTDPWEQRKFSDMYEVNNERNTDCKLGYDRTLSIATMTFNGGNGAADDSLNSYKVIRVGDIAFEGHANKVHAYGRFVLNDAGDGLMSPRFSCLRPIVEQRYSFWKYYIPYEETMRPILVKATKSGTMMNELVPDDLMRESILVPCLAEQEAIGDCLSQLDSLITLHQRKLELLQNIKKSLLDKMFV